MICVLYSSFHLVFYSLLKYELRNVTSTLCFYWLVYTLSVVLPSSVLFIMSLDILFSPLSLTFLSVYLYISGREGDVDSKSSVPKTVLSIFKFPFQILPTNRPKYSSSLYSTILSHFRRKVLPWNNMFHCRYSMLPNIPGPNINFSFLITTDLISVLNFLCFSQNNFSLKIDTQSLNIRWILILKEKPSKGKPSSSIFLNLTNTNDTLFLFW